MASQAKNNRIATLISALFFLLVAGILFYVTFSLRSEAQGREMKISLAQLYAQEAKHGDYLTIADTGAVISAASDVVDEHGVLIGRAFLLNGITNYIFIVGVADQLTDTTGKQLFPLQAGALIPSAFYARVNTQSDVAPFGAEEFAIENGLSTGQDFYIVQVGVTRGDTSVPFFLTLGFGVLALGFSIGSWWSLMKKKT